MDYSDFRRVVEKYPIIFQLTKLDALYFVRDIEELIEKIDSEAYDRGYEVGYEAGEDNERYYGDYSDECCPCHS